MRRMTRLLLAVPVALFIGCADNPTETPTHVPSYGKGGKPGKPGDGGPADPAIAFTWLPGSLIVMDAEGSNRTVIVEGPSLMHPSWAPDGSSIAFTQRANGSQQVWRVDIEVVDGTPQAAGAPVRLTDPATLESASDPAWSPAGDRIAFTAPVPGSPEASWKIMTVPAAGGDTSTIYDSPPDGVMRNRVTWSPDASQIAFVEGSSVRIVNVADAPTQQARVLIPAGEFEWVRDLDWSRAGDRIAFNAIGWPGGPSTDQMVLYAVDVETGDVQLLSDFRSSSASWSPDDSQLIVEDYRELILKIDASTGEVVGKRKGLGSGENPDWRRF